MGGLDAQDITPPNNNNTIERDDQDDNLKQSLTSSMKCAPKTQSVPVAKKIAESITAFVPVKSEYDEEKARDKGEHFGSNVRHTVYSLNCVECSIHVFIHYSLD